MDPKKVLEFYSREDIQKAICEEAKDKEIGIMHDWGYAKRPDVIHNPADVYELAKNGATSFHFSEELWNDPLQISSEKTRRELDELRKGWDLIIDIDTPHFEYSRIAADIIIEILQHHGVKSISAKFSGNHGFHIAIPFEAFPEKIQGKPTKNQFPEIPKKIALYLKARLDLKLKNEIMKNHTIEEIANNVKKTKEEIIKGEEIVEIDTVLLSSRHLCRMPYSVNEKSGLVSIPVELNEIKNFQRENASFEKIKEIKKYLKREEAIKGEVENLLIAAFDYDYKPTINTEEIEKNKEKKYEEISEKISEIHFPECIKRMLNGLEDGKKRALFILISFLQNVGWNHQEIEQKIDEWNKKNREPLKEVYVKSQLRYSKENKRLPPNCANDSYYKGIGVCFPDGLCGKIKNPVNYTIRKYLIISEEEKKEKKLKEKTEKKEKKETEKQNKIKKEKKNNIQKEENKEQKNIEPI